MPATWILWKRNRGRVYGSLPEGSFVLAPNHSGHFDWLLLDVMLRKRFNKRVRFVANLKVYGNPLFKMLIHECRAILVDYSNARSAAATMYRFLRDRSPGEERILGIFPEGTRTRTGRMNTPNRGTAWVARKAGLPIVPVALCGHWELWPARRSLPTLRRINLSCHFLDPIYPDEFEDDQECIDTVMKRVYDIVYAERAKAQHT